MPEKIKEALKRAKKLFRVILILIGAVVFLAHFAVLAHLRLSLALETIGLSTVITALVAIAINASFEQRQESSFQILRGTTASGTENFYPTRADALHDINERVEKTTRKIDVLAIAGTDLFGTDCAMLKQLDKRARDGVNTVVRVLLLDPRSYCAVERSLIEEGKNATLPTFRYDESDLCRNIFHSLHHLAEILAYLETSKQSPFVLEVRVYNEPPSFMSIRLEDEVFAEPYHRGITNDAARTSTAKCLGKAIPVTRMNAPSNLSQVLHSQFERIWKDSESRQFRADTCAILHDQMKKDWLEAYKERCLKDERELHLPGIVPLSSAQSKPPQSVLPEASQTQPVLPPSLTPHSGTQQKEPDEAA